MTGMSHQCHSALRVKARSELNATQRERERRGEWQGETTASMSCDGCDKVSFPSALLPSRRAAEHEKTLAFTSVLLPSLSLSLSLPPCPAFFNFCFPPLSCISAFFHGFRFCASLVRENYKRITNILFWDFFLLFLSLSLFRSFLKFLLQIFACVLFVFFSVSKHTHTHISCLPQPSLSSVRPVSFFFYFLLFLLFFS